MKFKIIVSFLLLIILAAGVWSGIKIFGTEEKDPARLKAEFLKGGDFTVTKSHSEFHLSDLKGKAVLLYFGFTSCPDVCPTGLSVIRSAMAQLGDKMAQVQVLFITVDPERDDDTRLNEYLPFFDARIRGVNPSQQELKLIANQYGVYYKKVGVAESSAGYSIDHTANFFLIDKKGDLSFVLDHAVTSKQLAETVAKLL